MRISSVCVVGFCLLLVSCGGQQYIPQKSSFFEGRVTAQVVRISGDPYVSLSIYEPGNYTIAFSATPGKKPRFGRTWMVMPKGQSISITTVPREIVIPAEPYYPGLGKAPDKGLPDYLRITISSDKLTEFKDF